MVINLKRVLSVLLSRMIGPAEKEKNLRNKYGFDITSRSEMIPYYVFVEISNELVK